MLKKVSNMKLIVLNRVKIVNPYTYAALWGVYDHQALPVAIIDLSPKLAKSIGQATGELKKGRLESEKEISDAKKSSEEDTSSKEE